MIFHLLLCASFSFRQTQYVNNRWVRFKSYLNLTQWLLTYWIVFAIVYLHSYLLIIDIL